MDRIELAFRKFDLNHDGYLSREEFDQASIFFFFFNFKFEFATNEVRRCTIATFWEYC